jgi:putative endonuclease
LYEALQDLFQNRKNNKTKGNTGEELACKLLVSKGYNVLARNWRYGKLEIDIITEYQNFVVFTEVKLRSTDYFMEPQQAVNIKKQKSIIKAADAFLTEKEIHKEARFDIIAITFEEGKAPQIEHFEEAFYPFM